MRKFNPGIHSVHTLAEVGESKITMQGKMMVSFVMQKKFGSIEFFFGHCRLQAFPNGKRMKKSTEWITDNAETVIAEYRTYIFRKTGTHKHDFVFIADLYIRRPWIEFGAKIIHELKIIQ